jgi:micrococcal nuclease
MRSTRCKSGTRIERRQGSLLRKDHLRFGVQHAYSWCRLSSSLPSMLRSSAWRLAVTTLSGLVLLLPLLVMGADIVSPQAAHVERVVDGDTLKAVIDGTSETIRVIGIDTPETMHPSKPVECFGREASNRLEELLGGRSVLLQTGASEDRDRYGRVLRYIELDGEDVGARMIRDGYAYSYKQYPHPRLAQYNQLEQEARDASRGLWSVCSTGAGDFTDVSASHPYLEAIRWGKETGVLNGYPDGSFRPDNIVNRAEFLKIVLAAKGVDATVAVAAGTFPDVDPSAWFAPYVGYARDNGIIQGYPDGTFRPAQPVNFAEALKMAYVALGIDGHPSAIGEWYEPYLRHAQTNAVLFAADVNLTAGMSRKDVVWIVWRLLVQEPPKPAPAAGLSSAASATASGDCTIKGNISSAKEKIYHLEGCGSYAKTTIDESAGEQWFCTEEDAKAAGWRKAGNCP